MTQDKIVFFGDSVTAEVDVALTNRWPYKVGMSSGYLPENIINSGIPGNRSDQLLLRLQADVIAHNPSVVVLMMTVNDKVNNITLAQHEANYKQIIEACQVINAKVVIVSPPMYRSAVDTWEVWQDKWSQLATLYGCDYIDTWGRYSSKYIANPSAFEALYADGTVHQTVVGNTFIHNICIPSGLSSRFVKNNTVVIPPEDDTVSKEDFDKVKDLAITLGDLTVGLFNTSSTQTVNTALLAVKSIT